MIHWQPNFCKCWIIQTSFSINSLRYWSLFKVLEMILSWKFNRKPNLVLSFPNQRPPPLNLEINWMAHGYIDRLCTVLEGGNDVNMVDCYNPSEDILTLFFCHSHRHYPSPCSTITHWPQGLTNRSIQIHHLWKNINSECVLWICNFISHSH